MAEVKAQLKYFRASPQKVRALAHLLKGKSIGSAEENLKFLARRPAAALRKLLGSARANARRNHQLDPDELVIKELRVDQGPTLKRFMPRAFGRSYPIRKRTSHITLVLSDQSSKIKNKKSK
ncbi:MAG: 50S ribosomal protein L22 [bacterium]|nr:50S ribosomal protein L22 [bacterium]